MKTIKCSKLYEWRSKWEVVGGTDLHDFFYETLGTPSPHGNVEVSFDKALAFVKDATAAAMHNNKSHAAHYTAAYHAFVKAAPRGWKPKRVVPQP